MRRLSSCLLLAFLWCLHWLPLPVLRSLGWLLGQVLWIVGGSRRRVGLTNLRLCFPERSEAERRAILKAHFVAFARAFLDRTLFWWASAGRIRRVVRLLGEEHLQMGVPDAAPVIVLAPHFLGLDAAGSRLSMTGQWVSMYSKQKNPVFDKVLYDGRMRFNEQILVSRQDGMRKALKAMRAGHPFYYLPDMDFGPADSIFVPFFGVPAATIPGVPRLAKVAHARVVPCITRMVPDGYEVMLSPAWENYPTDSAEKDTLRMNAFIEREVLKMPEQYYWLHKRFKTRPPGEARIY